MAKGTHDYAEDPRNETILINVNGVMTPRAQAMVSVFDSGFMLGDGVWEGLASIMAASRFSMHIWTVCLKVPKRLPWTSGLAGKNWSRVFM